MIFKNHRGFALPTILIASIIMLTVLAVTMASISTILAGIKAQGYDQMAQNASNAGLRYAEACLRQSDGVVTWSDNSPLTPATNCYGTIINGVDCASVSSTTDTRCFLSNQTNAEGATYFTSFSVGTPDYPTPGVYANLHSTGSVYLISLSGNTVWQTYSKSSTEKVNGFADIISDGLVMYVDPSRLSSYAAGGQNWDDLSGYGNGCTLVNNPVYDYSSGISSLLFNGSNNYANCGSNSVLNSSNMTYSIWVNPSASTSELSLIDKEAQYKLAIYQDHARVLFSSNGTDWATVGQDTTTTITAGQWVNITMVVNSSASSLYTYVNGNLIDTYSISAISSYNQNPTFIGAYYNGTSSPGALFSGKIGLAAVYNKALSTAEVHSNFDNTRGRYGL